MLIAALILCESVVPLIAAGMLFRFRHFLFRLVVLKRVQHRLYDRTP